MEAAGYEPKGRTHSNLPTFCWLWVTSGDNRTAAEAQQNTNGGEKQAVSQKGRGAVGGMDMCPRPVLKQQQHEVQEQSPYPPQIYLAKGQMNLAICHCQLKLSQARERAKGQAGLKCCALICHCIWGCFDLQGKKENQWQLHSMGQASQVCYGHHARHYGHTTLSVVSQ